VHFSDFDLSILGEIGNVSVGGAAASLSDFVNKIVTISIPNTKIETFEELKNQFEPSVIFAKVDFKDGLNGSNLLLMKKEEAVNFSKIIVKEKLGIDITTWDEFSENALAEVFNIMVGNMTSAMSELFHKKIKIETPEMYEVESKELAFYQNDEKLISIRFEIKLENILKVNLVKIITEKQASEMIKMIKGDHHL